MPPDFQKYRAHLDHFDLTEAQKIDLFHTVFRIMESFVDRAFGDDPVQHCLSDRAAKNAITRGDVIDLSNSDYSAAPLSQTFKDKKGPNKNDCS